MTEIAINGAAGRMGRRLVALTVEDEELALAGAIEAPGHALLGQDAGEIAGVGAQGIALADQLADSVKVLIDFTVPIACRAAIDLCEERGIGMVIGTTGLTDDDHARIDDAAKSIPVMQAPNMSLGVNLLFALAAQVAKQLGDAYDIEIVEAHHRHKKDAPSGTAEGIARAICEATGKDLHKDVVHGRHGDDVPRKVGEIGMHALRIGGEVGRHTACFGNMEEELQLSHKATSRDVFARGALHAAKWLDGKPAGRYTMANVLGI